MKYSPGLAAVLLSVSLAVSAQSAPPQPADGAASAPAAVAPAAASADVPVPASARTAADGAASASGSEESFSAASPESGVDQAIAKRFEQRFPGIAVDGVRATPMHGLYEVQVGTDLLYTDAQVDYVLQGSLIDAKARRDLTAERLEVLQRISFEKLPLKDAIVQVKGTGARKIATFEDPNCPYCKQLQKAFESIDDITIYTFLYPILTPDSTTKSRDIWCATDRVKAWNAWMVDGKVPAKAECDTPLQANLKLGGELNVQGTPALFFPDGSRVNGALPLDALEKKLAEQGAK